MLGFPASVILSAMCSAPIYGVNCLLAVLCSYALACNDRFKGSNWALAIVIGVQWVLSTGHFVSLFLQLFLGFVHPPALPLANSTASLHYLPPNVTASDAYFQDQSSPEHTADIVFYILNIIVADSFMTWRLYVVYDRRAWLAAPFLILNILTSVFGGLVVKGETLIGYNLALVDAKPELPRAITMWATSAATQIAGTLLIAYREISTPVYVPATRSSRYCRPAAVACAIVDSGAIYTLGIVFDLAFYVRGGAEGIVVGAILGQIASL
ncbi:hypothetical protein PENSPDRAFT_207227 [Peniophora sp. CONT]|nr:hypothetical protein PENSPDRAFT_207227 [Peniophora sp. CONT]